MPTSPMTIRVPNPNDTNYDDLVPTINDQSTINPPILDHLMTTIVATTQFSDNHSHFPMIFHVKPKSFYL
jgi:hypothetical protein